jgi:Rhodopirellula transposase DDE domain
LSGLLKEDAAGDPMGRRGVWTDKRLGQIAQELKRWNINVSASTVRRLLRQLGYGLHANLKSLSKSHPERDRQFQCIEKQRRRFARQALPIISVDTKKKELVGNFKNPGRVWSLQPTPVSDHDFRSDAHGIATPYGILDLARNHGSVFVGSSHDTPAFAAHNVARWWRDHGRKHYPDADALLILADGGGSNGARVRAWKWELPEQLVDPFAITVTVGHYPTGASKWNPIEHRLFSQISKHWAGQPLVSFDTIVRLIRQTKTKTGLRVTCRLVKRDFPTAQKISQPQMRLLSLRPHPILPAWNYTLSPRQNRN